MVQFEFLIPLMKILASAELSALNQGSRRPNFETKILISTEHMMNL